MLTAEDHLRLTRYLESHLQGARGLRVENVTLLHGGTNRDTYSFDATQETGAGVARRGFVLRLEAHSRLMDAERALEMAAYRSVQSRGVPAPMPVAAENDPRILGAPFQLVERVDHALSASPFRPNGYGPLAEKIGREFFALLGRLAAIDPFATELAGVAVAPPPEKCWSRELDYWERLLKADVAEPQPIAAAAIRRLRKNPPPPPRRLSIVHGDFRHGNFLHDAQGSIVAVLDWELTHIGDPMEDLAWSLDPIWTLGKPDLAAGLIPRNQAIALWEDASGQDFDAERYRWWSLFSSVKGLAIWASAAKSILDGRSRDPLRAFSGWYCTARHNQILAERLANAQRGGL